MGWRAGAGRTVQAEEQYSAGRRAGGQKAGGRVHQKLEISRADVLERQEMTEMLGLVGNAVHRRTEMGEAWEVTKQGAGCTGRKQVGKLTV